MLEFTRQLVADGGIVMWPLMMSSVTIWSLLVYRSLQLANHRFCSEADLDAIGEALAQGKSIDSLPCYHRLRGIQHYVISALNRDNSTPRRLIESLDAAVETCRDHITGNGQVVRCLIHTAPLLGLLGTVWGMIETFDVIAVAGTSEPSLLARGISIAMLTTQAGLLIAVPAIYIERRVARWEEKIMFQVDKSRLALVQRIAERTHGKHHAA